MNKSLAAAKSSDGYFKVEQVAAYLNPLRCLRRLLDRVLQPSYFNLRARLSWSMIKEGEFSK